MVQSMEPKTRLEYAEELADSLADILKTIKRLAEEIQRTSLQEDRDIKLQTIIDLATE